jgi:vacuolar-type H+-ATPase subunit H
MRILKWTGISLLVIILLLALIPVIFKGKIVAIVKEQANKNLNAAVNFGDFDVSLISSFPDFRFKMDDLSITGVDEFRGDTLAYIGHLKLDLNLKSVIAGDQYQINSIIVDNARILAKVLPSGKANWDITKPSADTTAAEDTSATKFKMKLEEFKIKNTNIVYDDQQGKMYASLVDLYYDMSGDFTQDNFTMKNLIEIASTTFKMDGVAYLNKVHAKLKADLDMDMPKMKFTFKENELALNDLTIGMDGYVLMPDTNIDMDLKFNTKQAEFKGILSLIPSVYSKDFASVKTAGKLKLDGFAKGRYNAVQMPAFALDLVISDAMFKYPSLPKSVNNINVDVKIKNPSGILDETTIDVNRFHVEMAGNPLDLAAHVRTPISDPGIKAEVRGMIDLGSVKELVPLDKGDELGGIIKADIAMDGHMSAIDKKQYDQFKASGTLDIAKMNYKSDSLPFVVNLNTMNLNFTTQYVELTNFDAMLGKSDIKATGKIENLLQYMFKDELIKGSFAITSALMDLNELMGTSAATTAPTETAAPTASTGVAAVPANIDFNLDAKIAKVLYTNLVLENMAGNVVVRNQKVDMTNLRMNVIGGLLTMNGYYETTNIKKPTVSLNLAMDNFDIQKTFQTFVTVQKLAPVGQYAKGTFTATLENFKTSLNENMDPDLTAVSAHGVFKTNKVSVGGFPPFVKLGEALKVEQLKNMEVNNVNVKYQIREGRLNLDPFDTKIAGVINTNITGSTGLDQTIDYKWKMAIPRKMLGGAANEALSGILSEANKKAGTNVKMGETIDVTALIGGTVTKPVIKTSLKEEAVSAVSTVTTEAVNKAIDKANEEAQKILDDAKKQVEKIKSETQALADRTRQEGYTQADQLVEQATNPIAKVAAKKAAEVAKKKTDEKVQKMVEESDARCNKILEDAKARADAKAAESKK